MGQGTAENGLRASEAAPADDELLARFVARRDGAAFAAIVERHGPTVLSVCRRLLSRSHDVEDAFQATFLVFARKAGSIRRAGSLRCWLYGVAHRTAGKLRAQARRAAALPDDVPGPDSSGEVTWREVQRLLDEELNRLPEKFRLPLLLCYLEGHTRDGAAARLGWGLGTLRGRLERGRDLLRARLAQRGVTLSLLMLATALSPSSAAVPPALLTTAAAGQGSAASAGAVALANGVIRGMTMSKMKIILGAVVALAVLGAGAVAFHGCAGEPEAVQPPGTAAKGAPVKKQPAGEDELARLVAASDRILVATVVSEKDLSMHEWETLKGPITTIREAGDEEIDPAKKSVAFLRSVQEGEPTARRAPAAPEGYVRPYSEELVKRVRGLIRLPAEWGPERDGLRLGLRLRQARFNPGEEVIAEVCVQNVGKKAAKIHQLRYNIYDYWPGTVFEVTGPDGRKWLLEKPVGEIKEDDTPLPRTLKPGETYIHTVRLNLWPVTRGEIRDFAANLFVEPGTYTVRCRAAEVFEKRQAELTSNAVKLELPPEGLGAFRAKDVRDHLDRFHIGIALDPDPPGGKWNPKYELRYVALDVPPTRREPHAIGPGGKPIGADARIPKEQAAKIVDVLAKGGYFDRAYTPLGVEPGLKGRAARISVSHSGTNPPTQYSLTLGESRATLRLLQAVRACVDGEAGQLLDRLLRPVEEESKQWKGEE